MPKAIYRLYAIPLKKFSYFSELQITLKFIQNHKRAKISNATLRGKKKQQQQNWTYHAP